VSADRDKLERLISRYLDEECDGIERRELQGLLRRDPQADALFEESRALDREVSRALRAALGRSHVRRRRLPFWTRLGRVGMVAAAACLALLLWVSPGGRQRNRTADAGGSRGSWFAPPPVWGDTLEEREDFERPQVWLDDSERQWIVVPSDAPGEYMVVEIKRVKTRTIRIQKDF